jgi:ABC-2 type transport system ATP-binding protein
MADADILIVDEVLAVGDADFQKKCFKYFKELKGSGKTVVLVTHDMTAVREYCDKAILIDEGVIKDEGDIESVTLSYQELFNPLSHSDAAVSRWGDGRAVIDTVSVEHTKRMVVVRVMAKLKAALKKEEILIAYAVKNEFGQKLFGNKSVSKKINALDTGAAYNFSFEFENILSTGRYFVDISIFSVDKNEYLDCWVDCAEFQSILGGVKGYSVLVKDSFDE